MERTLVIIKPDALQRGLVGEIIARFEQRGLKIIAIKFMHIDEAMARHHYSVHEGKPFFLPLITYITSAPVVVMVLAGPDAIETVRQIVGKTKPVEAAPGTIRADLAMSTRYNLVHASDGPQTAAAEIALFFQEGEIADWVRDTDRWISEVWPQ